MYNELPSKEGTYDRTVYSTRADLESFLSEAENLQSIIITDTENIFPSGKEYTVGTIPTDLTYYDNERTQQKSLFFGNYRCAVFTLYRCMDKDDWVKVELYGTRLHQMKRSNKWVN